jgi:hypothetical protein
MPLTAFVGRGMMVVMLVMPVMVHDVASSMMDDMPASSRDMCLVYTQRPA